MPWRGEPQSEFTPCLYLQRFDKDMFYMYPKLIDR